MEHDTDLQLHDLLHAFRLARPPGDRRPLIRRAARRRRWRNRAAVVGAVTAGIGLTFGLASVGRSSEPTITAGPARGSAEHVVEVAGLKDPIRLSETLQPVAGATVFGAVPLGRGAITGATQTTLDDGRGPVATLLAVTPGSDTSVISVAGGQLPAVVRRAIDGPTLIVIELPVENPHLVLEVSALDADGVVVGTARVTPFSQDPLDCDTAIDSTSFDPPDTDEHNPASYIAWLDAHLAAPVLPACDR